MQFKQWLTNTHDPKDPMASMYIVSSYDESTLQEWQYHLEYLKDKIIGEPMKYASGFREYWIKSRIVSDRSVNVNTSGTVATVARDILSEYTDDKERLIVLFLSTRNNLVGFNVVSVGTLDEAPVHPREVFRPAIVAAASKIIVAHNHPGGDSSPSVEDHKTTKLLVEAGNVLGIPMIDHIIIGSRKQYFSFADAGIILDSKSARWQDAT